VIALHASLAVGPEGGRRVCLGSHGCAPAVEFLQICAEVRSGSWPNASAPATQILSRWQSTGRVEQDEVKGDGQNMPNGYRFVNGAGVNESPMRYARWYPSATALENGNVRPCGHRYDVADVLIPEVYSSDTEPD
jgi:hypothetical protein